VGRIVNCDNATDESVCFFFQKEALSEDYSFLKKSGS